jgi:putative phosphoesterase
VSNDVETRRIGVISDTHDLLRPEALRALDGSDLILHAGDICGPEVLQALREIAPVIAVRGNNDHGPRRTRARDHGGGASERSRR